MGKRHMTNVEKVTHIMERSKHGALSQLFVMDALHKLAGAVSQATPEQIGKHGLINAEAWIATAQEIKLLLDAELTVEDSDYDDEESEVQEKPTLARPNGEPYIVYYEKDGEDCERSFVWMGEAQRFAAIFPAYEIWRAGKRIEYRVDHSGVDDDRARQGLGLPNASEA